MYQLHPERSTKAGCPRVILTGNNGNSRASTIPLDPYGNRISLLQASRDYTSAGSEIEFHNPSLGSGKRFLYTSYHELTHSMMLYNGDMHAFYNILQINYGNGFFNTTLNKAVYTQAGLKIFAERWAYNDQWVRYGINGSRINYVNSMWKSIITNPITDLEYKMLINSF